MNRISAYIRQALQDIYPPEEAKALSMMVCCDMLELNALDIYMGKDMILSESKQRALENIIFRLQKNEPIQYICGFAEFCGRKFRVAPGVLVPRPETAELARLIAEENPDARHVLDIGTGSGCIAITLDLMLPHADIDAWDISEEALTMARQNNDLLEANVRFARQDVLGDCISGNAASYDVIVSNPPYVTESEKADMAPNVLDWEPAQALFVPDEDPLLFYRRIADVGQALLLPNGRLYVEINQAYGLQTAELFEKKHYRNVHIIKDIFGKDRIVTANR